MSSYGDKKNFFSILFALLFSPYIICSDHRNTHKQFNDGYLAIDTESWTETHGVPLGRVVPRLLSGGVEERNHGWKMV